MPWLNRCQDSFICKGFKSTRQKKIYIQSNFTPQENAWLNNCTYKEPKVHIKKCTQKLKLKSSMLCWLVSLCMRHSQQPTWSDSGPTDRPGRTTRLRPTR